VAAERRAINQLKKKRRKKQLVWACLIPPGSNFKFTAGQLSNIDVVKANRWLKRQFRALHIDRVILGAVDLGWEKRGGGNPYLQFHWHLAMWTNNRNVLRKKLQKKFPRTQPYERPVHVQLVRDLNFLPYQNKVLKLPELLRRNRRTLAELLLRLDDIEPLDMTVLSKLRIVSTTNGFRLAPTPPPKG
jgi:hypothetical protein